MKGFKVFGWVSVAVVAILIVVFVSLFLFIPSVNEKSPFDFPGEAQALASVLALVFGTAATAGGAIATIRVATLGFEISERQDHIDRTQFIETRVTRSVDLYSNLLIALSNAYSSAVVVDIKIPVMDNKRILELRKQDAPVEVSIEMGAFSDRLVEVNEAISLIGRDEFAYFCFAKSAEQSTGKLNSLNNSLASLGVESSKLTLSVGNIRDIMAILDVASRRVRAGNLGDLIDARLLTNSPDTDLFGVSYDNRNVRRFMFMGNLIFSVADHNAKGGQVYIASFGAAIIHDLLYAVPDGKVIAECIKERYPVVSGQLPIQDNIFDPTNITSDNLLKAMRDADSIGDLYLLKAKE